MMRRRQGFLLIEALLAVVALAVGLVGVSAAIGSSLRALRRLQQADERLRLVEMQLDQAAVEAQQFRADALRAGSFEPPDAAYRWRLDCAPERVILNEASFDVATVTLTVHPESDERDATRLTTLWPAAWVAE